jgi:hypothetical protein
MSAQKILHAAMNAFRQTFTEFSRNQPEALGATLSHEAMATLTQGLMEAAGSAGQAGLAEYLNINDTKTSTVVVDGQRYRYKNAIEKTFLTLFGNVTVSRSVYGSDHVSGYVVPLDRALGIQRDEHTTLEAREMILFAANSSTAEEVAALLSKASLCRPCRSAVQGIIARDGAWMEQRRTALAELVRQDQTVPADADVLVVSMDGANVRLREPGVKKGRKAQRPRDAAGDTASSCSSFRNAMVGSFSWYGRDEKGEPVRLDSTYLARMPEDRAPTFKDEFERTVVDLTARAADAGRTIDKILLCDGHRGIWHYADHCDLLVDYHCCVDFYHTTEHLSKAAEAIFGPKSPRARWWYDRWREALKTHPDAPQSIIRSISGYMQRTKLAKTRREALNAELVFFRRNRHLMRYSEFRAKGYPIGSGPVEAAAKTIVKQRMCRSGMRWNRDTGQHVLTLRTYAKSKTWEKMWTAYTKLRLAA